MFFIRNCKTKYCTFYQSVLKLSLKKLFPDKVTIGRLANNKGHPEEFFRDKTKSISFGIKQIPFFRILSNGCTWTLMLEWNQSDIEWSFVMTIFFWSLECS